MGKKSRMDSIADLADVVAMSRNWDDLRKRLGYKLSGGMYKVLKAKLKQRCIDTSHFTGQGWAKGADKFTNTSLAQTAKTKECPWEEAFKKDTTANNRSLMKRLIFSGKKQYKCEVCGESKWQGKPLRLQLDHIDGDNTNAVESNLQIVCPNCHSQTDTFSRGLKANRCHGNLWWKRMSMGETTGVPRKKPQKEYSACQCGKRKLKQSNCCVSCARSKPRNGGDHPGARKFEVSSEDLAKLVWEMPTEKVAAMFGVSGKAIEKRCKRLGVQKPPRGYWAKVQAKAVEPVSIVDN